MKLLTMAAATFAVLFAAKPADAMVPVCLYDAISNATVANYAPIPGAQYFGDIFTPAGLGPIGNVDGVFVDDTGAGGNFQITVDLWNDACINTPPATGTPGTGDAGTATFTVALPATGVTTAYIITFPMGCVFTYAPNPGPDVAVSFFVDPPGCTVGVAPQLVPAFDNAAPLCGVDTNGFTLDINPQNCVLDPCGLEFFNIGGWTNGNMLVSLYDCSPSSIAHGPFAKPEAMVRKLDIPVKKHKSLLSVGSIRKR